MDPQPQTISRPPTAGEQLCDLWFRRMTFLFAWFIIFLVGLIVFQIARVAAPAVQRTWDRVPDGATSGMPAVRISFGILPEIWGTLYSSILGVAIGAFFGVSVAIFLTQDFLPHRGRNIPQERRRTAGGHPQRGLRTVGHLRADPAAAAAVQLAAREPRLDADLRRDAAEQPGHAAGRAGAGHHGAADDHCHLARFAGLGAAQAA